MRVQLTEHVRLPGHVGGRLGRVLQLRLLVVDVLQSLQVRQEQLGDGQEVSAVKAGRGERGFIQAL